MPESSLLDAPVATAPAPTAPPAVAPISTAPPSLGATPPTPPTGQAPAAPPISDPKPAATPETKPPADAPKAPETPVVPESYADPKLPEGYTLTPEIKTEFDSLAKSLALSQESYQKVIDLQIKHQENEVKAAEKWLVERNTAWADETRKEFTSPESLKFAAKAIDAAFSDPKDADLFRKEMSMSGYGNWKPMIKLLDFLGKQIGEDKFVDGKPAPAGTEKSLAQRLYPTLPSNPNSF